MKNPLTSVKVSGVISSLTLVSLVAAGAVLYNNGKVDAIRPDINKTNAVVYLPESVDNSHLNGATEQPFYEDIQVTDADSHLMCHSQVTYPTYSEYLEKFTEDLKTKYSGIGITYHYSGLDIDELWYDVALKTKESIKYKPAVCSVNKGFNATGGYTLSKFIYEYLTDVENLYNTGNNQSNIIFISNARKTLSNHLTNLNTPTISSKYPADIRTSNNYPKVTASNALRAWYIQTYLGISNIASPPGNRTVTHSTPNEIYNTLYNRINQRTDWDTIMYLKDLPLKFYSNNSNAIVTINKSGNLSTTLNENFINTLIDMTMHGKPIQLLNEHCFTIDDIGSFLSDMSYKSISGKCPNVYQKEWKAVTSNNTAATIIGEDNTSYILTKSCGCSNLIFIVHHPDGLPDGILSELDNFIYDTDIDELETYLKGKVTANNFSIEFHSKFVGNQYEEKSSEDKIWIIDEAPN